MLIINGTTFDTAAAIDFLFSHIYSIVLWSQQHFFTIPAIGEHVSMSISFYDLFFSAWAIKLIISGIPVIGELFLDDDTEDSSEETDTPSSSIDMDIVDQLWNG